MKWITRERVKVDRVACPWLIRKFVDKDSEFFFVPADKVMEEARRIGATAFDVPGVELGHHGKECSFDAILGKYGLTGDPRGPVAGWIERANAANRPILSLDTPSGLDTTTGAPGQPCIRAAATLTLALPKTGLLALSAQPFAGDLYLADIGVPLELYRRLRLDVGPLFADDTLIRVS